MKRAFYSTIPKCWDWSNFQYFVESGHVGDVNCSGIPMPAAGSKYYERVGNKIRLTRLVCRGAVERSGVNSLPTDDELLRFCIVYDRQFNAGSPTSVTFDMIFSGGNPVFGVHSSLQGELNPEYADRFVVLVDKIFSVPATPPASAAGTWYELNFVADPSTLMVHVDLDLSRSDLYSTFNQSGDCTTGQILVVSAMLGNSTPANQDPAWGIDFFTRFEFEDL